MENTLENLESITFKKEPECIFKTIQCEFESSSSFYAQCYTTNSFWKTQIRTISEFFFSLLNAWTNLEHKTDFEKNSEWSFANEKFIHQNCNERLMVSISNRVNIINYIRLLLIQGKTKPNKWLTNKLYSNVQFVGLVTKTWKFQLKRMIIVIWF